MDLRNLALILMGVLALGLGRPERAAEPEACCAWFADIAEFHPIGTYRTLDADFSRIAEHGEFETGPAPYFAIELPKWRKPLVLSIEVTMDKQARGKARRTAFLPKVYFLDGDRKLVAMRQDLGIRINDREVVLGFDSGVLLRASASHVRYAVITPNPAPVGQVVTWYDEGEQVLKAAAAAAPGAAIGAAAGFNSVAYQTYAYSGLQPQVPMATDPVEIVERGRCTIMARTLRRLREMNIRNFLDDSPDLLEGPEMPIYKR
jgi:hypothetical protein